MSATPHPSLEQLHAFHDLDLSKDAQPWIAGHVAQCQACQEHLQNIADIDQELRQGLAQLRGDRESLGASVRRIAATAETSPPRIHRSAASSALWGPALGFAAALIFGWSVVTLWRSPLSVAPPAKTDLAYRVAALRGGPLVLGGVKSGARKFEVGSALTSMGEVTTPPDTLCELSRDGLRLRLAAESRLRWDPQGVRLLEGTLWLSIPDGQSPIAVRMADTAKSKVAITLLHGECVIDRNWGDLVVCRRGRMTVDVDGEQFTLGSGQRIMMRGKTDPQVEEEYFPMMAFRWMFPLIDSTRTPNEFREWYRELLLSLGDTKADAMAKQALLDWGASGFPWVLDFLLHNRMRRSGMNYLSVLEMLPLFAEANLVTSPEQVELLFQLLRETRRRGRGEVARALELTTGVESPIPLTEWSTRDEWLNDAAMKWKKLWSAKQQRENPQRENP